MDAERFDRLVESLTRSGSRRGVLRTLTGTILGAVGIGAFAGEAEGKRKAKGRAKNRKGGRGRKQRVHAAAVPASCCSTGNCSPAPGKNLGKCCFEGANLAGQDFQGANLGGANLSGATLTNTNFSGANLGKACVVDAILAGATINGSTNTGGTIFCRTTMPDGSINNTGCNKNLRCCETCNRAVGERCAAAGDVCCGGATCCGGTCVDTSSDESRCGSCDNACGTGLTCCGGRCVDLLTDLDNCTECGNVCVRPADQQAAHVFVQCGEGIDSSGVAGYGCTHRCFTGFADCDGDLTTGCETPVFEDPNNCGACGNVCPPELPRCCGCKCRAPDSTNCHICEQVGNARLIRRR